ncbi:barstar family protein [Paenibacillus kribbensis]|uniref:barstar family protein n=1 Tax=Paenibacillus kribbensis TaxID=172713 RepID=UPI003F8BD283
MFNECINDLEWIQSDAYLVCISNAEKLLTLPETDIEIFVNILASTVKEWEEGRKYGAISTSPTPFNVIVYCTNGDEEKVVIEKFQELGVTIERM